MSAKMAVYRETLVFKNPLFIEEKLNGSDAVEVCRQEMAG